MPTLNTTPNQGYQLPFDGNNLSVDVARVISAISAIDVNIANALAALAEKAGLASPAFTGTPTAPTAAPGADTGQVATTAFVKAAIDALQLLGMSKQDAANVLITGGGVSGVAITGGTIDDTPIGGTTPSTGKFTSVELTAQGALTTPAATGYLIKSAGHNTGLYREADGSIALYTGGYRGAKVNLVGIMTKEHQPAFEAYGAVGAISVATNLVFPSVNVNVGGHYNVFTGRFTAPVSGTYWFSGVLLGDGSSAGASYGIVSFLRNGATVVQKHGEYNVLRGYDGSLSISSAIYMTAGDYVQFRYEPYSSHRLINAGVYHRFCGFLIG